MRGISMREKISWSEIEQRYPAQWVRIEDADLAPDGVTITAGVVTKHGNEISSQDHVDVGRGLCYTEFIENGSAPSLGGIFL